MQPVALTIAGSDSGGGAGIQADLKTFAARGVFGATAITCLTAQNPDSVTDVMPIEAAFLREQISQVGRYFDLGAIKTGMLFSAELIRVVAGFLKENPGLPAVVDPVMVATSGAVLLKHDAINALKRDLLPLATLITPNLDEAGVLLGATPTRDDMEQAARTLAGMFRTPVLLKGGHLAGSQLVDILALPGDDVHVFENDRIQGVDTHGSGCTLSAAIAAELAKGQNLLEAVRTGRSFLNQALRDALTIGARRFINHGAGAYPVAK